MFGPRSLEIKSCKPTLCWIQEVKKFRNRELWTLLFVKSKFENRELWTPLFVGSKKFENRELWTLLFVWSRSSKIESYELYSLFGSKKFADLTTKRNQFYTLSTSYNVGFPSSQLNIYLLFNSLPQIPEKFWFGPSFSSCWLRLEKHILWWVQQWMIFFLKFCVSFPLFRYGKVVWWIGTTILHGWMHEKDERKL